MKLRNALLVATVLAAPVAAQAQPVTGLYVGAGVGGNYLAQTDVKSFSLGPASAPISGSSKLSDAGGFVGLASIGYGLGNGLRIEVEGDYRQTHTHLIGTFGKTAVPGGFTTTPVTGGGNDQTYGPMFNVLYDFQLGSPITPYIGAGVGYGFTTLQNFNYYTIAGKPYSAAVKKDAEGAIAVQAIVGAAYNIPTVPGLALTAEVRGYGDLNSERFKVASPTGYGSFKLGDQANVSALIGLRYAFNAAPPPPPPAPQVQAPPAAAPSRTYLVFFDWDKADLTARARQIIAEAAQNSTKVHYTRIEVNGNTDTSGTAAYNQRLSVRRAESVAAELVKDGVPRTAIDIHGYGDTRLLVPTGPGIREPQNRRVEIVLQ